MNRRRLFWVLVAATLVVYAVMVLWSLPRIMQSAGGLLPFDLRPMGYSTSEAVTFLDALNVDARAFYLGPQHWLDLLYPALLGATLVWATLWAWRNIALGIRGILVLPAIVGMVFDWIENARVAGLLQSETVSDAAVRAASFATVMKSMTTTMAMVILLVGLIFVGWHKFKGNEG